MDPLQAETGLENVSPARLARLVDDLRIRLRLLLDVAWDVNLLALAAHDAVELAGMSRQIGFDASAGCLDAIATLLEEALDGRAPPDEATRAHLAELTAGAAEGHPALDPAPAASGSNPIFDIEVSEALPIGSNLDDDDGFHIESARSLSDLSVLDSSNLSLEEQAPVLDAPASRARPVADFPNAPDWSIEGESEPRLEVPTPRMSISGGPASARTPDSDTRIGPSAAPTTAEWLVEYTPAPGKGEGAAAPAASATRTELGPGAASMAYLLAAETAFAASLERGLKAAGFEVHRFSDPDELAETVGALVPAVVITAPESFAGLETVAQAVTKARKRANAPIVLMTIAAEGSIPTRLAAMRAGVDVFIAEPVEPAQVVSRLAELSGSKPEEPFRILIVEDDRPQAVFAESILRKAGMQTRAVHDPLEAIDALEEFDPELVLMDLRMPGCNGIELTTLIRERDRFVDVPIVFLSGEQNAERRYDALAVGGDDYLEKPIKPKFLLSAVTNRVRRARAVRQRGRDRRSIERSAALYDRMRLVDRIGDSLVGAGPTAPGGILFLIVDGAQALRQKLGLMAFDLALQQAGAMLAESLGEGNLAARFGDSSFVVLAPAANLEEIRTLAARFERAFAEKLIESESGNLTLAVSVGIATFSQGWRDAAAILNAAERAADRARRLPGDRIVVSPGPGSADATDADAPLRNALAAALAANGIHLLYQPIASLKGRTDELFQVLVRVRDPNGRDYAAAELVPMAERNGLIHELDRAVLARCVEVLGERLRRGRKTALLASQSIHGLGDVTRFDWLRAGVEAHGVDPAQLILELRHDDVVPRLAAAGAWLAAARAAGFRTAISAFEPNPASLQSLQHLAVDLIRVNGRFIAQLDADRSKVLADLVEAAHGRGAMIVAPMVEDARTAAMLWGTGVDFIQGDFVQSAGQELKFDFHGATL